MVEGLKRKKLLKTSPGQTRPGLKSKEVKMTQQYLYFRVQVFDMLMATN